MEEMQQAAAGGLSDQQTLSTTTGRIKTQLRSFAEHHARSDLKSGALPDDWQ